MFRLILRRLVLVIVVLIGLSILTFAVARVIPADPVLLAVPGTGKGTTGELDGIRYLQTTLAKHALPDLWAVRTVLRGA